MARAQARDESLLEDWNPRQPPPDSVRFDNQRKRGVDAVRVSLDGTSSLFEPMREAFVVACLAAAIALKPNLLTVAMAVVVVIGHGIFLYIRRRQSERWDIGISPDMLTIVRSGSSGGSQQTWHLAFTDIEHIAISPGRRGRPATVRVTTHSTTVSIGAGQSEAVLVWLKNLLIMELAGLTWRPLFGVDRRHSRNRDALVTNPLLLKPDLALRLIEIFTAQAPEFVKRLGEALSDQDAESARQYAHWLKGSSANVGARHMSELCQLMETYAKEKDFDRTDVLFREIERKCSEVIDWLGEIKSSAADHIAYKALDDEAGEASPAAASADRGPSQADQGTAEADTAAQTRIPAKILVVDDSAVSREIAKDILEEIVTEVVLADDGIAALKLLNATRFDLALMDCEMFGLNGYQCTRRWRNHEAIAGLPRMPIIAATAHALKGDRARCIAAGMDDYLSKPFLPDELREKIEHWLRNPPASASSMPPAAIDEEHLDPAAPETLSQPARERALA